MDRAGRVSSLRAEPANWSNPNVAPDGQRIVFRSGRDNSLNLYWRRADGTGDVQRLTESPNPQTPASWHPSGMFLAFYEVRPTKGNDLMILPIDRTNRTVTLNLGAGLDPAQFVENVEDEHQLVLFHDS